MRMRTLACLLAMSALAAQVVAAQAVAPKPALDLEVLDHTRWPRVFQPGISHDGRYVFYTIHNQPVGGSTLVLQATEGAWRLALPGASQPRFTEDSRRAVFRRGADSLGMVTLGDTAVAYRPGVQAFELFTRGTREYLAYRRGSADRALVIEELATGRQRRFPGVTDYRLSEDGRRLLLQEQGDSGQVTLVWVDLATERRRTVWRGTGAARLAIDDGGTRAAFLVEERDTTRGGQSVWYYGPGLERAVRLIDSASADIDRDLKIESVTRFSRDGGRLFITLKERDYPRPSPEAVAVDVWHYRDARLQSQQLAEDVPDSTYPYRAYEGPRRFTAVLDLETRRVHRLQFRDERLHFIEHTTNDDWALITQRRGHHYEEQWNPFARARYYLVSTRTGERIAVPVPFYHLSPAETYLIGNDDQDNFFSYELATGVIRDLTRSVPVSAGDGGYDTPMDAQRRGLSFWGHWLVNEAGLLLYDRYDIWQVDPRGVRAPVNLTHGYGRRHQVIFRFLDDGKVYDRGERVILDAFDARTKANGFYSLALGAKADPVPLTMGPYVFTARFITTVDGEPPVKARDAQRYLVRRGSVGELPNYFWTDDFKRFTLLSRVYPERRYNWVTSELVTFPTLDGRTEQGILYKPEDFDSTKKYPVIVHYYETKSEKLNDYPWPDFSDGDVNIPYFVGRGYLVFTPDIHYTVGAIGRSAYNSIVGAGEYLARQPWVDAKRMGLSGHSFGGSETNYVITHSNLFAAAVADAGVVNLISQYGRYELQSGVSMHGFTERAQNRMGASLWERPELYIQNSPIFRADKVTTPVLLVNNKLDAIVHFEQGVAFFTALRRLGKRAWLLQYDGEPHSLQQQKNQRDLTIRITQFFDHYLKGAPAPVWMTRGIPAKYKGVEDGLDYDPEIATPGPGLVQDTTATTAAAVLPAD